MSQACGWAVHLGLGLLLALWGHTQWPLVLGGLLPLAAWLAITGWLQGAPASTSIHTDWAQRAARLGMVPMMAGLPTVLDLCSGAGGGVGAAAGAVAGHAAAMALPPVLLGLLPSRLRPGRSRLCAALLLAGGAALLLAPGVQGLMLAMLAHAAAFGVAVCGAHAHAQAHAQPAPRGRGFDLLPVCSVLAMGAGLSLIGPQALFFAHGALAAFGLALVAARTLQAGPEPARF